MRKPSEYSTKMADTVYLVASPSIACHPNCGLFAGGTDAGVPAAEFGCCSGSIMATFNEMCVRHGFHGLSRMESIQRVGGLQTGISSSIQSIFIQCKSM